MSNYLAIATVTAALGEFVHTAAEASKVGSVGLDFGRPTAAGDGQTARKVQIYLYQVSPNPALRNNDLPTRRSDGKLADRPQAALDLHYLIAFYGDQQKLEAERMLGAVVRNLHARPLLSRQSIQEAITNHPELNGSNLADAIERVRFTPAAISLDELSKLWSVFFQTPHALSVAYNANVVLIEADESGPSALPVLQRGQEDRGVDTSLGPFPALDTIHIGAPEDADRRPRPPSYPSMQLGVLLTFSGRNLGGESVEVHFKHPLFKEPKKIPIPQADRTATQINITLPDNTAAQSEWAAGLYSTVVVVKNGTMERSTNQLPLALAPKIKAIAPPNPVPRDAADSVTLTITCGPKVLPPQRAVLQVADREVAAQPIAAATDTLQFVIEDAPVVTDAVVRLRVDGIDSLPFKRQETPPPPQLVFDDQQKVTIQ